MSSSRFRPRTVRGLTSYTIVQPTLTARARSRRRRLLIQRLIAAALNIIGMAIIVFLICNLGRSIGRAIGGAAL